ncbi:putative sulfate exporter family transporter [Cetobacterium somerae]|uniref:YeiH family protein n=1 Tax=Cetobacterium sp. NK01 TaxID=2993530 RepID=UPI00211715BE|nr:putative sulfate exporter family transporter [Cetobacterium sp. NK01]MCQ8211986.1 putative sulfate exporter family transporter [Cetobacterium sp. NK01]
MTIFNTTKKIIPGLLICILIAQLGVFLGKFVPSIGGAPLAIFLGLIAGNTFAKSNIFASGSKFSESDLLSYSIVLLGGTLSINTILQLGFSGIAFILLQMALTIALTMFIGKKLGFSKHFRALMASGNAVCGSSAIGASSPVINAEDNDKGISITIVNLTGTLLMFALIPIAGFLYNFDTIETSALIGGILQSVGQVIAAGSMVNHQVLEMATIFKIVRIVFLVIVVLWLSREFNNKELEMDTEFALEEEAYSKKKSNISVPWYIIGFFVLCILFSFGLIPAEVSKTFKMISSKFEIVALAGIGMRVNISELVKQGPKASLYGLLVGLGQIVIAVTLIKIFI